MNITAHTVLFALFDLARTDRHATILRLAEATGLERREVVDGLDELDRGGYADADRVRLTLQGLGAAALLGRPAGARRRAAQKAA